MSISKQRLKEINQELRRIDYCMAEGIAVDPLVRDLGELYISAEGDHNILLNVLYNLEFWASASLKMLEDNLENPAVCAGASLLESEVLETIRYFLKLWEERPDNQPDEP